MITHSKIAFILLVQNSEISRACKNSLSSKQNYQLKQNNAIYILIKWYVTH